LKKAYAEVTHAVLERITQRLALTPVPVSSAVAAVPMDSGDV